MITLAIILIALVALYLYNIRTFDYWEKRGVKHDKPIPFFGNNARNYLMRKSVTQIAVEMYWKYPKEKIVGFFRSTRPELVIRDPDIVKHILITDFVHFYPRGLVVDKRAVEPIMRNLFFADGDLWRLLRQRMTPAFTSGKLKAMFPLIVERAERLQERTLSAAADGRSVDARDLMARYTTDFIGACGFGIDADSLNEEDSEFRKLGAKIFKIDTKRFIITAFKQFAPRLFFHLRPLAKVEQGIKELLRAILKERNYQPSSRHDFIDLLIESKNKGTMVGESIENIRNDGIPEVATLEMDEDLMAAQIFIFFAAGFETSSSATSYTLHQLALNPEVQKKVQADIDRVLAKYDHKLSYDAVKEMTYLYWTFKEGMRMFPSLGFLMRECARKYTIPDIEVTIDEGVRIFIPIQAMQMDPKYFENPEEFRPERFSPEEFDANQKSIYLPFGIGPRACIDESTTLLLPPINVGARSTHSSDSSDLDESQMEIANQMQNIMTEDFNADADFTSTLLETKYVGARSSSSSDLDESLVAIASQMHNIVNEDYNTDSDDEIRKHLFGSDDSNDDPTYVPDVEKDLTKGVASDCSDIIPENPSIPLKRIELSMTILEDVLGRVWTVIESLDKDPCYVQNSDNDSQYQIDTDCNTNNVIIQESPSYSEIEETVTLILDNVLDGVWTRVKPLKRRRIAQPGEWKKNIAKKRKMEGLPYITQGILRSAKVPKPIQCDKCQFKCTDFFSTEDRNDLCRHFYGMDFKAQKNFILSCVEVQPVKTRRVQKTSNKKDRSFSKKCFMQKNNERYQVCQKFFLATLCISMDVMFDALKKRDALGFYSSDDKRGKKIPPNKTKDEDVKFLKEHIESFPVMESHYCRKDSKKKYFYPDVKSVVQMYRMYESLCKETHKKPVSASKYRKVFTEEYNFSFYSPKKDLCNLCSKYQKAESKEDLEDEYQEHITRKTICQQAKDADKARANTDETFMSITMDLQAVLQMPNSGESILYYMRKLVLYNFTIYEASLPNNAYCLCWSEINGKKGSCEIGTCLFYYLTTRIPKNVSEISIFSDTCSGQNRNQYVSTLLLWAVQKIDHLNIIEQKFLESGHTHMEVDSMHAAIENASKNVSINSVSEWKNVFKQARAKKTKTVKTENGSKKVEVNSYEVKEFKYHEMLDLKKLSASIIKNKSKDTMKNSVNWLKIKRIRYVKGDFKMYFNYDMSDDFRELDILSINSSTPKTRAKRHSNPPSVSQPWPEEIEYLYSSQLPISLAKKKDLLTMCKKEIIPEELHSWIQNLKTSNYNVSQESDEE